MGHGRALMLLATAALIAACGPTASPQASPTASASPRPTDAVETYERYGAKLVAISVRPAATDPRIDSATEPHLAVIAPTVAKRGQLFIYLPGTQGRADEARHLTELAAARGMHAIGLRYPNYVAVQELCAIDPDHTCFEKARTEAITGQDLLVKLSVDPANSILNRVDKLLAYLADRRRDEGWGRYLRDGRVDWSSVVLAGTSQGGGMAAMIARDHVVGRVVMFSSPVESFTEGGKRQAAPWTAQPHVTPSDHYFGFAHLRDAFGIEVVRESWTGLGLAGPEVNVDTARPPFTGAHRFVTDRTISGVAEHPTPVVPVTENGAIVFLPVWEYLFGF